MIVRQRLGVTGSGFQFISCKLLASGHPVSPFELSEPCGSWRVQVVKTRWSCVVLQAPCHPVRVGHFGWG
jgi:hypothetical protein